MIIDYSLIKKYAYGNPEFEFNLLSTPYETKFPDEVALSDAKRCQINELCCRFSITNDSMISAFFWISHWMGSASSITSKKPEDGKIFHSMSTLSVAVRESNVKLIELYKLFSAKPEMTQEKLLKKKIVREVIYGKKAKPYPMDEDVLKKKLDKLRRRTLSNSFFAPGNIKRNYELSKLGRGKKPTYVNQHRKAWLKLMFGLLKENTRFIEEEIFLKKKLKVSDETIFVICGWLFYINGHIFHNRKKQPIDPTDPNLYKEDISKPLRSLMN